MNDDGLIAVRSIPELVGADVALYPGGVCGVLADHQHERLYCADGPVWGAVVGGVQLQFPLCVFVAGDTVGQHQLVQRLVAEVIKINVGTGHREWSAGVSVLNGLRQRILIHHILKRDLLCSLGDKRCGGELQTQQRVELVQGLGAPFRPVVMGFVHNQHQVRQAGEILVERVTDPLVHLFHVGVFLVELVDVVDKNTDF